MWTIEIIGTAPRQYSPGNAEEYAPPPAASWGSSSQGYGRGNTSRWEATTQAMTYRYLRYCMPAIAAAVLLADLLEPGHFQFFDLPFALRSNWGQVSLEVNFDPPQRLSLAQDCQRLSQHPQLLQTSVVLSQQFPGQSEQDLLTQLGPPACRLADGAYQWLLDNGMTLQTQLKGGEVSHVQISDPAIR